ncbi:MAG: penicillin-binding protein 2 [Verrucomicrobiota bacterium]|nr:penicillin-binding protein 2 [Verrucomicrobiota bacterium]
MTERSIRRRILIGGVILILILIRVGLRLATLHLGRETDTSPAKYDSRAILLAGRGTILDCRGTDNALALNLVVKDICADPRKIVNSNLVAHAAAVLSEYLNVPADELADRINRPERRFAYLKRYVPEEEAVPVLKFGIPGLFLNDTIVRHYPHRAFMCHVLGFVNYEGAGSSGVEQTMDVYLRGSPGYIEGCVNARREELYWRRNRRIPALAGANVTLTLDQNVQYMAEKALDEVMAAQQCAGAWCIVERVKTGEILALACRPAFNPNEFRTSEENSRLNRAIGFTYEPGSTFKVVAIAAALNEGAVRPDTEFDCENGAWKYAGKILHDVREYGILSVADIVKKSSNIGAAKVALILGEKRYYDYLKRFGLGARAGIDLPGEETGILNPVEKWARIDITRIAMGQSVAVTALQMVTIFAAFGNEGFLMRPYLVKSVNRVTGETLYQAQPEVIGRPIAQRTARAMRELLRRVTEEGGTGTKACVEGYDVAGKTGTAQKALPGGGFSATDVVSSFVGLLPADDPEIVIAVVVDSPRKAHYGGIVAAPVFGSIAAQAVRYLEIPPTRIEMASR